MDIPDNINVLLKQFETLSSEVDKLRARVNELGYFEKKKNLFGRRTEY